MNLTVREGQTVHLPCHVKQLGRNNVAWVRSTDSTILSMNSDIITHDKRFGMAESGDREETSQPAGQESRVSSMIARLSNGARQEDRDTNTSSNDRKQFMSKFIKNDKENHPESKEQISRESNRENSHNGIDESEIVSKATDEKDLVSKSGVEDVGHDIPDINIQTNGLAKVCHESSSPALDKLR